MRTEPLVVRAQPSDPQQVSQALQDAIPGAWKLTDRKGDHVPVSSAGCVLHFGREYQLRIALAEDHDTLPELRLMSWPGFVAPQSGTQVLSRHGHRFLCLSFRVERESGWHKFFKWPYEVLAGDLRAECGNTGGPRGQLNFPVAARTSWSVGIVLLLIAGAVAGWLGSQILIVSQALAAQGAWPSGDLASWWASLQRGQHSWLWPLILALVNPPAAWAWNAWQLWQQSRTLRRTFEERYSDVSGNQSPVHGSSR